MAQLSARIRLPFVYIGVFFVVIGILGRWILDASPAMLSFWDLLAWSGFGVGVIGLVFCMIGPAVRAPALALGAPVKGRWLAVNSPASKVPSHGTHGYAQTYALDLVFSPDGPAEAARIPVLGGFDPPTSKPGFGQPIVAPADGVVQAVLDGARDHRCRTSWIALLYLVVEGMLRELYGPRGLLGNYVILRLNDGSFLTLAHLRRGSTKVRPGDTVKQGDLLAECGNSGNSTEPHLHVQRQDTARLLFAAGLPWTIEPSGMPVNGSAIE